MTSMRARVARWLEGVGPRSRALEILSRGWETASAGRVACLVVDGVLQARPYEFACSLLTIDEDLPWGSGKCPPAGDLKAPREALLAAADAVVSVGEGALPQAGKGALPQGTEDGALPPTFV